MYCNKCGNKLKDEDDFCHNCGSKRKIIKSKSPTKITGKIILLFGILLIASLTFITLRDMKRIAPKTDNTQTTASSADANKDSADKTFPVEESQWTPPANVDPDAKSQENKTLINSEKAVQLVKNIIEKEGYSKRIYKYEGIKNIKNKKYHYVFSMTESSHSPIHALVDIETGKVYEKAYDSEDIIGELK